MTLLKSRYGTLAMQEHAVDDTGDIEAYIDRITALANTPTNSFFVTAKAIDQPHFIQVSVGGAPAAHMFQFDMPIVGWSSPYAKKITAEAKRRGLTPVETDSGPMQFLDIDFADAAAHADFARWVVRDVFGLPATTRFEITSDVH